MTLQVINVGNSPNDGQGDAIRTAYIKCNDNFAELYSRVQDAPPATLVGTAGDLQGMTAYDDTFFYYCFQDYDGSSVIWNKVPNAAIAQVTTLSATGNITGSYFIGNGSQLTGVVAAAPTSIVNGTTNITTTSGGNANITIGGTSNVAVFATTGLAVTGISSATGNITGGNLLTAGLASATGNVSGGNLRTAGQVSATGNITGGNVTTGGKVNATGNISATGNVLGGNIITAGIVSGAFIYGDGGFLSNVTAVSNLVVSSISNGSSSISISGPGSNATITVAGTANVLVASPTGVNVAGYLTATSTITGQTFYTNGTVDALGNITGGNLLTGGLTSATGNITGGNLRTGGLISATGNITGGNVLATTIVSGASHIGSIVSVSANVTGGNLRTGGVVSATGNITAGGVVSATGNVTGGNLLTAGIVSAASYIGSIVSASANITGGNLLTGGLVSVTGNITAGGVVSATGNVTGGNILSGGLVSVTGSITGGGALNINSGNAATAIVNSGGNGVGNIGSATTYFNTVFAVATSAQYADLAECYLADADYEPGTVLSFGGSAEVTMCTQDQDPTIVGVVSTAPAYLMNTGLVGDYIASVALVGRIPVKVIGPVTRGAMIVSAGNGYARAESNPAMGTVIGKAVESFDGDTGIIEVVVGRL